MAIRPIAKITALIRVCLYSSEAVHKSCITNPHKITISIYTCIATSANARPSSEFKERNINGATCQIGQTDIIASAQSENLPLIQILSSDLPAFMEATNTGKVVNNKEAFFQALKQYEFESTVDGPILRLVNVMMLRLRNRRGSTYRVSLE
jgi:hypothetical protein